MSRIQLLQVLATHSTRSVDQLLLSDSHFQGSEPLKADNSCKSDHPAPSRPADNQKTCTAKSAHLDSFHGLCNWLLGPITAPNCSSVTNALLRFITRACLMRLAHSTVGSQAYAYIRSILLVIALLQAHTHTLTHTCRHQPMRVLSSARPRNECRMHVRASVGL